VDRVSRELEAIQKKIDSHKNEPTKIGIELGAFIPLRNAVANYMKKIQEAEAPTGEEEKEQVEQIPLPVEGQLASRLKEMEKNKYYSRVLELGNKEKPSGIKLYFSVISPKKTDYIVKDYHDHKHKFDTPEEAAKHAMELWDKFKKVTAAMKTAAEGDWLPHKQSPGSSKVHTIVEREPKEEAKTEKKEKHALLEAADALKDAIYSAENLFRSAADNLKYLMRAIEKEVKGKWQGKMLQEHSLHSKGAEPSAASEAEKAEKSKAKSQGKLENAKHNLQKIMDNVEKRKKSSLNTADDYVFELDHLSSILEKVGFSQFSKEIDGITLKFSETAENLSSEITKIIKSSHSAKEALEKAKKLIAMDGAQLNPGIKYLENSAKALHTLVNETPKDSLKLHVHSILQLSHAANQIDKLHGIAVNAKSTGSMDKIETELSGLKSSMSSIDSFLSGLEHSSPKPEKLIEFAKSLQSEVSSAIESFDAAISKERKANSWLEHKVNEEFRNTWGSSTRSKKEKTEEEKNLDKERKEKIKSWKKLYGDIIPYPAEFSDKTKEERDLEEQKRLERERIKSWKKLYGDAIPYPKKTN
jgi:hypothetical protein